MRRGAAVAGRVRGVGGAAGMGLREIFLAGSTGGSAGGSLAVLVLLLEGLALGFKPCP